VDLLRRFALGEIDAFETLVRQFQGVAEDLTVETLWLIYQARHQFRSDGNFGAWARRIATNLALDHLQRKRRKRVCLWNPPVRLSPIVCCSAKHGRKFSRYSGACPPSCRLRLGVISNVRLFVAENPFRFSRIQ
jgi:Sigma-70 region 2